MWFFWSTFQRSNNAKISYQLHIYFNNLIKLYCFQSFFVFLFKALEQDIASRQSSISAMKAKVKKFVETADPSAAALLQSKMDSLSQRFSDACDQHRQKIATLEKLKEKVEQFENVAEKVQQFVLKRSQDLHETDGPGKTFNELSQLMQVRLKILTIFSLI